MTWPSIIYQWLVTSLKISVSISLSCAVSRIQKQMALQILLENQFHFVVVHRMSAQHPPSLRSPCWRKAPPAPPEYSIGDDISKWVEQRRDLYEWVSGLMAASRPALHRNILSGNQCPSYSPSLTCANEMNMQPWVSVSACSPPLWPLTLFFLLFFCAEPYSNFIW